MAGIGNLSMSCTTLHTVSNVLTSTVQESSKNKTLKLLTLVRLSSKKGPL